VVVAERLEIGDILSLLVQSSISISYTSFRHLCWAPKIADSLEAFGVPVTFPSGLVHREDLILVGHAQVHILLAFCVTFLRNTSLMHIFISTICLDTFVIGLDTLPFLRWMHTLVCYRLGRISAFLWLGCLAGLILWKVLFVATCLFSFILTIFPVTRTLLIVKVVSDLSDKCLLLMLSLVSGSGLVATGTLSCFLALILDVRFAMLRLWHLSYNFSFIFFQSKIDKANHFIPLT